MCQLAPRHPVLLHIHWKYANGCRIQSRAAAERPGKTRNYFVVGTNMHRAERILTRTVQLHSDSAVAWAAEEFRQGKYSYLLSKVSNPALGGHWGPSCNGNQGLFHRK